MDDVIKRFTDYFHRSVRDRNINLDGLTGFRFPKSGMGFRSDWLTGMRKGVTLLLAN